MKRIPNIYWQENYENLPSLLQQAWVQRWFELLDSNTSYIYAPPIINVVCVLDELVNGFHRKNERTCYFLLRELVQCYCTDPVLEECRVVDGPVKHVHDRAKELLNEARELFHENGCLKDKSKEDDFKESIFNFQNIDCKILLKWLREDKWYRELLCEALQKRLLAPILGGDVLEIDRYGEVDTISQNLVIELLTEGNYSVSFLKARCVELFLKRRKGESFDSRIEDFLGQFSQEQDDFVVYMRIQVGRTVRDIQQIGEITLRKSISKDILSTIERISEQHEWASKEERRAKNFFYDGRTPPNLIFAIATNIRAEDAGNATAQALDKLEAAIQKAKFEYELRGFSLDRRVYVYNKTKNTLKFISTKELRRVHYGSLGDSLRFERLKTWLSLIEQKHELKPKPTELSLKQKVANNVTETALAWHRDALDAKTVRSQFLNHWISLEQIFEPLESISFDCKKTPSDKAVFALAEVLSEKVEVQILLDLLGDMRRIGFMGPPRLTASRGGFIKYSDELLNMPKIGSLRYVPYDEHSRPKLFLVDYKYSHTFRLQPGSIVLVQDRNSVFSGQWLTGAVILRGLTTNNISSLFCGVKPNVENLLYLAFYEYYIIEKVSDDDVNKYVPYNILDDLDKRWLTELSSAIKAMRWYDQVERLLCDISRFTNQEKTLKFCYDSNFYINDCIELEYLQESLKSIKSTTLKERINAVIQSIPHYKPFFDLYATLRSFGHKIRDDLPNMVFWEAFRNQTSNLKRMESFLREVSCDEFSDQPLLRFRLHEVKKYIEYKDIAFNKKNGNYSDHLSRSSPPNVQDDKAVTTNQKDDLKVYKPLVPDFLTEADRMRRARNQIAHNGQVPQNIDLLVSRLYKYARSYLREVLYAMATTPNDALDEWLSYVLWGYSKNSKKIKILEKADLPGVDLRGTDQAGVEMNGANLSRANLNGGNLSGAILSKANLSKANLSGANLSGANLSGANLSGANLSGANLSEANLSETDLSGADLSETNLSQANLINSNLSQANLCGVNLRKGILRGATLDNTDFRTANLNNADLRGVILSKINLHEANLCAANLSDANLSGADLIKADLRGAKLKKADLRNAKLSKADLRGAKLNQVIYNDQTQWPEEFDYVKAGAIKAGSLLAYIAILFES